MIRGIAIFALGGFIGWIAGYVLWYLYPTILVALGIWQSWEASLYYRFGPPALYQVAWLIVGAFIIWVKLGRREKPRPMPQRKPSKIISASPTIMQHIEKAVQVKESEKAERRREIELQILKEPKNATLHLILARDLRPAGAYIIWSEKQKDDVLKAEAEYKQVIQLKPDLVEPYLELGMLHFAMIWQVQESERRDLLLKAESELTKALRLNPNLSEAHKCLGRVYRFLKKYDEAERHFKVAIQLRPYDKMTLYWLGMMLLELGKVREATDIFQKVFPEYDPSRHKIERTELVTDFFSGRVKRLGLVLIDKENNKRIRVEEIQDFSWLD